MNTEPRTKKISPRVRALMMAFMLLSMFGPLVQPASAQEVRLDVDICLALAAAGTVDENGLALVADVDAVADALIAIDPTLDGTLDLAATVDAVIADGCAEFLPVDSVPDPVARIDIDICLALAVAGIVDENGVALVADVAVVADALIVIDPTLDGTADLVVTVDAVIAGSCADFLPEPTNTGTLEIIKYYCPDVEGVETDGNIGEDCTLGDAPFTVYLFGDGTDEIIASGSTGSDGVLTVTLAAGTYQIVEEIAPVTRLDVVIVAGESTTAIFENPVYPGTGQPTTPGTDQPTTPGTDQPTTPGTDQPTTPGTDQPTTPGTDQSATSGVGTSAPAASSTTVTGLPSTGSGETGAEANISLFLLAGVSMLAGVGTFLMKDKQRDAA